MRKLFLISRSDSEAFKLRLILLYFAFLHTACIYITRIMSKATSRHRLLLRQNVYLFIVSVSLSSSITACFIFMAAISHAEVTSSIWSKANLQVKGGYGLTLITLFAWFHAYHVPTGKTHIGRLPLPHPCSLIWRRTSTRKHGQGSCTDYRALFHAICNIIIIHFKLSKY